jgi:hypothetical protein
MGLGAEYKFHLPDCRQAQCLPLNVKEGEIKMMRSYINATKVANP